MAFIGGKTNRQILNKEPADYLENKVIPKRGEEALASQLITLDRDLWKMQNYQRVLPESQLRHVASVDEPVAGAPLLYVYR
jgi:hypothetical protein